MGTDEECQEAVPLKNSTALNAVKYPYWTPLGDWAPKPSSLWRCFKTEFEYAMTYLEAHVLCYPLPILVSQKEGLICMSLLLYAIS